MPNTITPSWPKTGLAPAQGTKYNGRTAPACVLPPRTRRDPVNDADLAEQVAQEAYSQPVKPPTLLERLAQRIALQAVPGLSSDDRSRIRLFEKVTVNDVMYYVQNPGATPAAERARLLENYAIFLNFVVVHSGVEVEDESDSEDEGSAGAGAKAK
ncbi:hypothetical protein BJX99DRAFT_257669 [Aspergillus californicus]